MSFDKYNPFKSNGVKINHKIIYSLCFMAFNLLAAVLIVWQPLYFFYAILAALVVLFILWKTEVCLLVLIFYLPFQIALNVSQNIDLASSRALIGGFFAIWLAKSLAAKKVNIVFGAITALVLAFMVLAALSAVFSIEPDRSYIRLLYFLSIIPLYFVAADYLNSAAAIRKVFLIIAASGFIAAFLGIIQFAGQFVFGIDPVVDFMAKNIAPVFYGQSFSAAVLANPSWLVNIGGETYLRAISLFPDPHMFAFYLGLVIPLALVILLRPDIFKLSSSAKILIFFINIVLFLALGFTFSRAGYIGALFGIGAIFALNWRFLDKKIKLAVSGISIVILIVFLSSSNLIVSRFFAVFNLSEGSNSERLVNWSQAIKIIEDHPLTGVGVGSYSLAVDPQSSSRSAITAHNTYLDIAAEMGIFALLAWVLLLGLAMKKLYKTCKAKNNGISGEENSALSAGVFGALAWFSVQAVFDTAIYSPTLFAILMIYLAVAVNLEKIKLISKLKSS